MTIVLMALPNGANRYFFERPESRLFHKGEHLVVFDYATHVICDKNNSFWIVKSHQEISMTAHANLLFKRNVDHIQRACNKQKMASYQQKTALSTKPQKGKIGFDNHHLR